jgi:hypothetical protein
VRSYAWDYLVASVRRGTAMDLLHALLPAGATRDVGDEDVVEHSLLEGLFAALTSAGVLFSMLAAADQRDVVSARVLASR